MGVPLPSPATVAAEWDAFHDAAIQQAARAARSLDLRLDYLDATLLTITAQVLDAKLQGGVLMVIAARVGRYEKLIFRFDAEYDAYDVRVVPDIAATGLNFVALAHGVCLHLNDKDKLEIFPARTSMAGMKVIADPALGVDCLLLCDGPQALMARGGALSGFAMR